MSKNRFAGLNAAKRTADGKEQADDTNDAQNARDGQPRRGRPATGKRSDADFRQVTSYVRRATYKEVSKHLFELEPRGEFSELVERLLQEWLKKQGA